jgi:hypothetical protein
VLSIGPVDDAVRSALVASALALVQPDPAIRVSVSVLEAWLAGRIALVARPGPPLADVMDRLAPECVYETRSALPSCLASVLSRRGPREVWGARLREHARRLYVPSRVVAALEACVAQEAVSR